VTEVEPELRQFLILSLETSPIRTAHHAKDTRQNATSIAPGNRHLGRESVAFNNFGCRSTSGIPEARSGRRIIVAAIRTSDCERRSKNVLAHSVQPLIRFRFADISLTNRAAAL